MDSLLVVVPTRGRPWHARELIHSCRETASRDTQIHLQLVVDDDDPELPQYRRVCETHPGVGLTTGHHRSMVEAINREVTPGLGRWPAVAVFNDDHRPRTVEWDRWYLGTLSELGSGMVYGNDLVHGPGFPTQIAMTTDIPLALGWLALPTLWHWYVDNVWLDLGRALDRIRYLDHVTIEHVHPLVGKADWDPTYQHSNNDDTVRHDQAEYRAWRDGAGYLNTVRRLQHLRGTR